MFPMQGARRDAQRREEEKARLDAFRRDMRGDHLRTLAVEAPYLAEQGFTAHQIARRLKAPIAEVRRFLPRR